VTTHHLQEVVDLLVYQPYLRGESSIIAIGLDEIPQTTTRTTKTIQHPFELQLHSFTAEDVNVDILRGLCGVRTNVGQCALRELNGAAHRGTNARHILSTAFPIP
jgi:hypothetical protein